MKILAKRLTEAGNTLLVCLVATGVVGFTLSAYLTLIKSQNQAVVRSQVWNTTVSLIEAGMEEAMAHLNMHGSTNLQCDGWTMVGNKYVMERTIGDGFYNVAIANWFANTNFNNPTIESRAFITNPTLIALAEPGPFMASANTTYSPSGKLGRGVKATVGMDSLFGKGLVAKGQINMSGNNLGTDSYDSLDPNFSTPTGGYDPAKTKAHGNVATDASLTNSVDVGNATIRGDVSTGPKGTVKIGPQGIVTGKITDDMNVAFPDVTVPFAGGGYQTSDNGSRTVSGVSYTKVFDGGIYKINSLSLSGQQKVLINGDVSIWLPAGFSMSAQGQFTIAANAKLTIYAGASCSISGNGFLSNADASRCIIYGLPTCTSLSFSGNARYTGCIYAPSADFSMSGGGNDPYDFAGASITKTVTMSGGFNFHFDEALKTRGPGRGFIITSWNEMTPNEVTAIPSVPR